MSSTNFDTDKCQPLGFPQDHCDGHHEGPRLMQAEEALRQADEVVCAVLTDTPHHGLDDFTPVYVAMAPNKMDLIGIRMILGDKAQFNSRMRDVLRAIELYDVIDAGVTSFSGFMLDKLAGTRKEAVIYVAEARDGGSVDAVLGHRLIIDRSNGRWELGQLMMSKAGYHDDTNNFGLFILKR